MSPQLYPFRLLKRRSHAGLDSSHFVKRSVRQLSTIRKLHTLHTFADRLAEIFQILSGVSHGAMLPR